jgi:hypothetical protein
MPADRPTILVEPDTKVTRGLPTPQASEPHTDQVNSSFEPQPLDWHNAVLAAAARLNENFGTPDPMNDPLVAGMAQEVAALLSAYGEIAGEVGRMQAHANECHPAGSQIPVTETPVPRTRGA